MNRHFSKEDIYEVNKHEKNAHHHWSLEKCKSKLHWDTISSQLEWQSLKNLDWKNVAHIHHGILCSNQK